MSTIAETLLKDQIKNVLRRFKFEELEDSVLSVFPETTWSQIKSQLVKQHEKFTTANVAIALGQIITDKKLRERELKQRLTRLELIEISRHKRKLWYTYSLSGSNNEPPHIGTIDFNQTVKEKLHKKNFKMKKNIEVDAIIFNGIMYLSIKYVTKNSLKTVAYYYAIFLDNKYIFSAQKIVHNDILEVISHSMGYNKYKSFNLNGKDLMSLIRLLRIRQQGAETAAEIINIPKYKKAKPIIRNTGIDFTQNQQRRKFLENRFGVNPPTLDTLIINGPDTVIYDREIAKRLKNHTIKIGWEFRSQNIATFLKTLFERGILLPPLSPYISDLMLMGRNELTLEK